MLKSITIQNYALIEKAHIEFNLGFSAITGETGAGKSILLGALGLILGNRADQKAIKDTQKKCIVEGEFILDHIDIKPFFQQNDLDFEAVTLLRREINNSGKSRAFINDSPVSLNVLKELAEQLVNIHSQHQTLNLGKVDFQLNALDAFINDPDLLIEYQRLFESFKKLKSHLQQLKLSNEKRKKDEDYFKFQLTELESVKLDKNVLSELTDRENFLSNAEEIASGIKQCMGLLDENEPNVIQKLSEVQTTLNKLAGFHSNIKSISDRLHSVWIEMKDITAEINHISDDVEFDPQELLDIKNKLDKYYSLQQKHHLKSIEELIVLKNEIKEKLNSIETIDDEIKESEVLLKKQEAQILALANELHKQRAKYAELMSKEVKEILKKLGINNAEFVVQVEKNNDLNGSGIDEVAFLFSANKGGKPEQLSAVASGGELSRLMLAIKSLIHQKHILPTVIFDEIDAGVSGEIAGKVGSILKKMSEKHQVLAITHLPQIAAKAEYHYSVYKTEDTDTTSTRIELLDKHGRIEAIARMLSDENLTNSSLMAARELLGSLG
ncbi:MAG: DNA repair protein RecN [Bacteroidales bacterium]|jgi:DNA repair protein RecN (Recombination protein N)|nr:DNA repair protein RecN [Bacteroidales bacterium]